MLVLHEPATPRGTTRRHKQKNHTTARHPRYRDLTTRPTKAPPEICHMGTDLHGIETSPTPSPHSATPQPEAPQRAIATAPPWQTCQHPTNLPHHMAQPGNTNRKTTHQCSTWMNDSAVPGRGPPRNRHPPRCVLSKHLDLVPLNAPTERQTSSEKQGRQGQGLRNGFARRGSPKPRRTRKNHS